MSIEHINQFAEEVGVRLSGESIKVRRASLVSSLYDELGGRPDDNCVVLAVRELNNGEVAGENTNKVRILLGRTALEPSITAPASEPIQVEKPVEVKESAIEKANHVILEMLNKHEIPYSQIVGFADLMSLEHTLYGDMSRHERITQVFSAIGLLQSHLDQLGVTDKDDRKINTTLSLVGDLELPTLLELARQPATRTPNVPRDEKYVAVKYTEKLDELSSYLRRTYLDSDTR